MKLPALGVVLGETACDFGSFFSFREMPAEIVAGTRTDLQHLIETG